MRTRTFLPNSMEVLAFCLLAQPCLTATWYVDSSVATSGNGTSWGTAFKTIQEGTAAAADGDTVVVADGTYTNAEGPVDFQGKAITLRSQNGPSGCILDCEGSGRGFYLHSGEDQDSVIDGFTVTHAYAVFTSPDEYDECGGAIVCDGSSPTITNCVFSGNRAYMSGGAIFCQRGSPLITHCEILGNRSEEAGGGGIACFQDSNPTISDCTFSGNEATGGPGAAIHCLDSSATIVNSVFSGNTYEAISCHSSSVTIDRCTVSNSKGPGIVSGEGSSVTVLNCVVFGNHHGGVACWWSNLLVTNCTIVGHYMAAAIHSYASTFTVRNSILWENLPASMLLEAGSTASVAYSDIQGGFEGEGNLDADPTFVALGRWDDAGTPEDHLDDVWVPGDLRLESGSPCVDCGNNAAVPSSLLLDLDGNLRIANGIVDMGAYEFGSAPAPSRLYVDAEAKGTNDGTSWADAFTDLQDALYLAESSEGAVREIWVADGTYCPSQRTDPADPRSATFQLLNGVTIYGGFAGGETELSQRNPAVNQTVLSGDLAGDDSPDFGKKDENSYHIVTGSGTDATAVLDGFTITGGNAGQYGQWPYLDGGGMYNANGSPTAANCTFRGNSVNGSGGGMANYDSSPSIINCTFVGNQAGSATGVLLVGYSQPTLVNCRFIGNDLHGSRSNLTLINCVFTGSRQASFFDIGSATFTNCTIAGNQMAVGIDGGAVAKLTNCILWNNDTLTYDGCEPALDIRYSCVEGQAPQGPGNISPASAGFVDVDGPDDVIGTEDDDLRLLPVSPCIDSGDTSAIPPSVLTDLDKNPRIISGKVDMGAFEFQGCPWLLITEEADLARLDWRQFGDGNYTVEWTGDLVTGLWQRPSGTWPITGLMWTDIASGDIVMRFYRVESGGIYTDPVGFVKVSAVADGLTMLSVPLVPADNRLNGDPGCIGDILKEAVTGGAGASDADVVFKWNAKTQSYTTAYVLTGVNPDLDGKWWDEETSAPSTVTLDVGECFWVLRRTRAGASQ